jgi:hypothetical protein
MRPARCSSIRKRVSEIELDMDGQGGKGAAIVADAPQVAARRPK